MSTIRQPIGTGIMKKIIPVTVLAALVGMALPGCSHRSAEESAASTREEATQDLVVISPASARDLGISVTAARRGPLQGQLTVPAQLLPHQDHEAVVGSLVQGRVYQVLVNAGDQVRKGQELALIEGLEIGEIKAAFIKARAQYRYAEAAARRQRMLHDQNVGAERTLLEAEAEFQKARAEFTAEDRKIHSIGLTDADVEQFVDPAEGGSGSHVSGLLPIRTPLAGVVAERNVIQGQLVEATTNAFRIVETGVLWADGQLHERDLNARIGDGPASLTVSALPDREFTGTVIFVSPVVDPRTRTVTVRAAIPNRGGLLKPNMFGELHLHTGTERNALLIPREAVARIQDSSCVFVSLSDSVYARRHVSLGAAAGSDVEVTAGIDEGDRVVTNGSFVLKSEQLKGSFGEAE